MFWYLNKKLVHADLFIYVLSNVEIVKIPLIFIVDKFSTVELVKFY